MVVNESISSPRNNIPSPGKFKNDMLFKKTELKDILDGFSLLRNNSNSPPSHHPEPNNPNSVLKELNDNTTGTINTTNSNNLLKDSIKNIELTNDENARPSSNLIKPERIQSPSKSKKRSSKKKTSSRKREATTLSTNGMVSSTGKANDSLSSVDPIKSKILNVNEIISEISPFKLDESFPTAGNNSEYVKAIYEFTQERVNDLS